MSVLRHLPASLKESLRRRAGAVTLGSRLENLRRAGFDPKQIIDAGAFRGEWSLLAHEIFPAASLLLIEPNPQLREHLEEHCRKFPHARLRAVILGSEAKTARFVLADSNSRVLDYEPDGAFPIESLPVETLRTIVDETGFGACDFLKLDLQGYELEALKGAGELFGTIEVIMTEVSWLKIGEVPLVDEVISRFYERGYRLYDVLGLNYRPLDGALWQSDLIFVRKDSRLVQDRRWST